MLKDLHGNNFKTEKTVTEILKENQEEAQLEEQRKTQRLIDILNILEKNYKSVLVRFINFINYYKYDFTKDKNIIIELESFVELFYSYYYMYIFSETVEGETKPLSDEELLEIFSFFNICLFQNKLGISNVISHFVKQHFKSMQDAKSETSNDAVKKEMLSFYDYIVKEINLLSDTTKIN